MSTGIASIPLAQTNLVSKDNEFQTVGAEMQTARFSKLIFAKGTHNKRKDDDRNVHTGSYGLISSAK